MPADRALLDLPFDQYGRHTLVERAVAAVRGEPERRLRILDVGGYPCWTPRFLPKDEVTVLDVQGGPEASDRFVIGDGARLPFRDGTFDVVVTLDSLEHIPRDHRPAFLAELTRVARDYVFLTAPFGSDEVRLAESLLFEFVVQTLQARQEQLMEHAAFGLPEVAEVEAELARQGHQYARLPTGSVARWLMMMLAKHHVMGLESGDELHRLLDRFYNVNFFATDQAEPAYRQLWLIAVAGDVAPLNEFVARQRAADLDPVEATRRLAQAQLLIKLLDLRLQNKEDARLREQLDARDENIRQLETARDHLTGAVQTQHEHIAALERQLQAARAGLTEVQAALYDQRRRADSLHAEAERTRIMLATREQDVAQLNAHIARIASGRVMRTLNLLQRRGRG